MRIRKSELHEILVDVLTDRFGSSDQFGWSADEGKETIDEAVDEIMERLEEEAENA